MPSDAHPRATLRMLLALGALLAPTVARAQPAARPALNDITWQAPSGCPDVSQIHGRIIALTTPEKLADVALMAHASVSAHTDHFTARIELEAPGASESKVLRAADCATLADAYALIVAFVLDPSADRPNIAPARAAAPARTAERSPATHGRKRPFRLGIAAVGALGVGHLPFPAFGVGGRVRAGRFLVGELGAQYWFPRREQVSTPEGSAGADVSLIAADAALCVPLAGEVLGACLGASAGSMRASGSGVPHPSEARAPWGSADAALTTLLPIARKFALRFRLALGVPFSRPRFVLDDLGAEAETRTAFRPEAVFGTFSIAPELRFFSTESDGAGHATR